MDFNSPNFLQSVFAKVFYRQCFLPYSILVSSYSLLLLLQNTVQTSINRVLRTGIAMHTV